MANYIGQAVKRVEDKRFITGKGRYTDDIKLPGMTYAAIVRSPHAHATIDGIDTAKALAADGVVAAFVGQDLADAGVGGLPCGWQVDFKNGDTMKEPPHPVLAVGKVRHVGDPVAIVIAETREQARDAAELVEVDYGVLPAAVDMVAASGAGAPLVHDDVPNNVPFDWGLGDADATARGAGRRGARHHAGDHQSAAGAQTPSSRVGAIGDYDGARGPLHAVHVVAEPARDPAADDGVRAGTAGAQGAGGVARRRRRFRQQDLPLRRRGAGDLVLAPDSATGQVDRAAQRELRLRRAGPRSRDQGPNWGSTPTASSSACGSPPTPTWEPTCPPSRLACPPTCTARCCRGCTPRRRSTWTSRRCSPTPYRWTRYAAPGRPEATYLLERLVDTAAHELDLDPGRIAPPQLHFHRSTASNSRATRRRVALQYDSGNYPGVLEKALEMVGYEEFRKEQAAARAEGRYLGIGFSTYIEACGIAPSAVVGSLGARAGLFESAVVRVPAHRQG